MARLIRGLGNIKPDIRQAVVTIGNFDGVHLGHQKILQNLLAIAKARQKPHLVITFEPHPAEFFAPVSAPPRITRLQEKLIALINCGIEHILLLPFNADLANMPARDFIHTVFHDALDASHILVGDDFRFGKNRLGDYRLIHELSAKYHYTVSQINTVLYEDERISSTRIRKALAVGDLKLAHHLLGRPFAMQGRVAAGDQRGRAWGFPTANIFLHRKRTPIDGVFSVLVHGISDNPWPGAANVGTRPTIGGTRTLLEVHLLDFDQMIYGKRVQVQFCHRMRDEIHYVSVELLKAQIAEDVRLTRLYFKQNGVIK